MVSQGQMSIPPAIKPLLLSIEKETCNELPAPVYMHRGGLVLSHHFMEGDRFIGAYRTVHPRSFDLRGRAGNPISSPQKAV